MDRIEYLGRSVLDFLGGSGRKGRVGRERGEIQAWKSLDLKRGVSDETSHQCHSPSLFATKTTGGSKVNPEILANSEDGCFTFYILVEADGEVWHKIDRGSRPVSCLRSQTPPKSAHLTAPQSIGRLPHLICIEIIRFRGFQRWVGGVENSWLCILIVPARREPEQPEFQAKLLAHCGQRAPSMAWEWAHLVSPSHIRQAHPLGMNAIWIWSYFIS